MAMWAMRHAIVVIGGGEGSGIAKSMTASPIPTAIGVVASARGRMLQHPGTGSHKYCSSVSESSRGRSTLPQWNSSWSTSSCVQSIVMVRTVPRIEDRFGPQSGRIFSCGRRPGRPDDDCSPARAARPAAGRDLSGRVPSWPPASGSRSAPCVAMSSASASSDIRSSPVPARPAAITSGRAGGPCRH